MNQTCALPQGIQSAEIEPDNRAGNLFAPTVVAGLKLRNRWVMAPMTRTRSPGGVPDDVVAEYYRRRAAGGIGLIITEGVLVDHPTAGDHPDIPHLRSDSLAGWAEVVKAVDGAGSRILAQLWHLGSEQGGAGGITPWTPSGVREDGYRVGPAMSHRDIETLIEAYADAARAAVTAGFHGVEVHAAHGYLLDEFLWPATNRRTDAYGGTPENRSRLLAEIVNAIRAVVPAGFVVGVRFSQFKERAYQARIAASPNELERILRPVVAAGADLFHASTRRVWEPAFAGSVHTLAGWTKTITGRPVIAVGSVGLTERSLQDGGRSGLVALTELKRSQEFDLLALGRPLLANPAWVNTVVRGDFSSLQDYRKTDEDLFP